MLRYLILIIAVAFMPLTASALTIDETVTLALDTNNNRAADTKPAGSHSGTMGRKKGKRKRTGKKEGGK